MRTEFKKSFLKDLKRRKKDQIFLNNVKEIVEEIEAAGSIETDVPGPKHHNILII